LRSAQTQIDLKVPHRRNLRLRHLSYAKFCGAFGPVALNLEIALTRFAFIHYTNLKRVVDRDFALHASDSLLYRGRLGWNWRSRRLRGGDWDPGGLRA
jgi:hypothetical protein